MSSLLDSRCKDIALSRTLASGQRTGTWWQCSTFYSIIFSAGLYRCLCSRSCAIPPPQILLPLKTGSALSLCVNPRAWRLRGRSIGHCLSSSVGSRKGLQKDQMKVVAFRVIRWLLKSLTVLRKVSNALWLWRMSMLTVHLGLTWKLSLAASCVSE